MGIYADGIIQVADIAISRSESLELIHYTNDFYMIQYHYKHRKRERLIARFDDKNSAQVIDFYFNFVNKILRSRKWRIRARLLNIGIEYEKVGGI